jgi:hypothetical protein
MKTPTPQAIANQWIKTFSAEVRDLAGADGKLSRKEAANNAIAKLVIAGEKKIDVEDVIARAYKHVLGLVKKASGNDGKVSKQDAKALPPWLVSTYVQVSKGKPSPATDITKAATDFVLANSGGSKWEPVKGKMFPAADAGEAGFQAYAATGTRAMSLASLAAAVSAPIQKTLDAFGFDPQQHAVIAGRNTDDEESLFVAVFDPKTGKGAFLTEIEGSDIESLSDLQKGRYLPSLKLEALEIGPDMGAVINALVKGLKPLETEA